jgi:cytochrome c biogenesis protein CcmG, thiol:disulfide interchange protein DsbE
MRLRNTRALLTFVALAALVAAVVVAAVARQGHAAAAPPTPSPPLAGRTLQRTPFDLAQTLGKPTVVDFFASWCPSCASETADLVAFATAHPEINVVGVAIRDKRADVQHFVAEYRLPYTVVMDPMSIDASAWGVIGIPATFFLDAQGRTVTSMVGAATRDQFEEKLKSVL